ncbi:MAG: kynU [Chitinophagaceae bacterium]|nr:kynU [Chitinophagaceae bacterium]
MIFNTNKETALKLDAADELRSLKTLFHFPQLDNKDVIYFCGNSLGLLPKNAKAAFDTELESWKELAIAGYMAGKNPWLKYQEYVKPALSKIVGAKENEVTVMNALTVNLHLMMMSFYKPTKQRFKIIMEAGAFPSDQYAVETQVKHYGFDPDEAIIEIAPRNGEKTLHTSDIIEIIEKNKNELALVLLGGINYYTGQFFDMSAITKATHDAGALAGWDLAHAAGNVRLQLHEWNVDFAVWCSYKYLNSGPGAVGGCFVHEKFANDQNTHRFGGWWGNDEKTRFKMEKGFIPKNDASGWNISTAQVFNTVALKASLEIFEKTSIEAITTKSDQLTGYLEYLLSQIKNISFDIITPSNKAERGAQLSLYFHEKGKDIHQRMIDSGIVVDYREPGVIRVAPAPLYCSFEDVNRFYEILLSF